MNQKPGKRSALTGRGIWGGASPKTSSKGFALEALENRRLLSAGAVLGADGILTVTGTNGSDELVVVRDPNDLSKIRVTGKYGNAHWGGGGASVPSANFTAEFNVADVRGIVMYGLGEDDYMYVLNNPKAHPGLWFEFENTEEGYLNIPVTMYGGAGDDEFFSQTNADDTFVGGAGKDLAYRTDGVDTYGVEFVENYRDMPLELKPDGKPMPTSGAVFKWTGPQDVLYVDPFAVYTAGGEYYGPHPEIPVEPVVEPEPVVTEEQPVVEEPLVDEPATVEETEPTPLEEEETAVELPAEEVAPEPVYVQPPDVAAAVFGVRPIVPQGPRQLWDDADSRLL